MISGFSGVFVAVCQPLYVTVTVSTSVGLTLNSSKSFILVRLNVLKYLTRGESNIRRLGSVTF